MTDRLFPMTAEQYNGYLKSAKWRAIRNRALKRDGHKCVDSKANSIFKYTI